MKNIRKTHLKVKIKTLVAETKIIYKEENKLRNHKNFKDQKDQSVYKEYQELKSHRIKVVKDHTRHNLLAYGALRNIAYSKMEIKCHQLPHLQQVIKIAKAFNIDEKQLEIWIGNAICYLKKQNLPNQWMLQNIKYKIKNKVKSAL